MIAKAFCIVNFARPIWKFLATTTSMIFAMIVAMTFTLAFTLAFTQDSMAASPKSTVNSLALNAEPPVRLKNFREIYFGLSEITNISEADDEMRRAFSNVKDRLPKAGSPQEFSSPTLMALTELSAAFCKKAIASEKKLPIGERTLFSDIDFQRGPIQFSDFLNESLIKKMSRQFWQREIKTEELVVLEKLINDSAKVDKQSLEETESVLQLVCTAFGSSLSFAIK